MDLCKECSRTGQNSEISRFLQTNFLGTKIQEMVEIYLGRQYSEQISKDREIKTGNTIKYKDLPSARGVGNVQRLKGYLLSNSNAQPVQEICIFSCSRLVLPNQSTIFLVCPPQFMVVLKEFKLMAPHKGIRIHHKLWLVMAKSNQTSSIHKV